MSWLKLDPVLKDPAEMARAELEEEVLRLRDEIGLVLRANEVTRVMEVLDLQAQAARVLLVLYHAKGRTVPKEIIEDNLQIARIAGGPEKDRWFTTYAHRIRSRLGHGALTTHRGIGLALTPEGRALVDAALRSDVPQATALGGNRRSLV